MRAAAKDAVRNPLIAFLASEFRRYGLFQKERGNRARRRQLLHLTADFLREEGLFRSADALASEAGLDDELEVCDNVDLDSILRDYCDYFQLRFDKQPQLCKKVEVSRKKREKKKSAEEEEVETERKAAISPEDAKATPALWEDAKGAATAKACLLEALTPVADFPQLFPDGRPPWKGVLLHGPPGNGKTTLARAAASVSGRAFFDVSPAVVISKWRGESEKIIKVRRGSEKLSYVSFFKITHYI